jgi:hypothetical protein
MTPDLSVTYAYRVGDQTHIVRSHMHGARSKEEYARDMVMQLADAPGGWLSVDDDGACVIFPVRWLVHVRIEEDGT